jgi:hypothetical protein
MNAHEERPAKRNRRQPWWKIHEKVCFLFEKLLKPLESDIRHNTQQRDIVGIYRQLDVGIIDDSKGERRVKSFVEVQKRKKRVGLPNLGDWEYKRKTLGASEMTIISEAGFANSVIAHVNSLHPNTIKLGKLHPVETGLIERFDTTCLGITRTWDNYWIRTVLVQFADDYRIEHLSYDWDANPETKAFGTASVMDLVRNVESQRGNLPPGMHSIIINCNSINLNYKESKLQCVIIILEKVRKIWEPLTRFFAYSGVYPATGQQGLAIISDFKVDHLKTGKLILVVLPDLENLSGNHAMIAGQLEIS